jgi:hypothetical protein
MSRLTKQLKKLKEAQNQKKNLFRNFANPPVAIGKTLWPKGEIEQAKVGFRWDLDVAVTLSDGRPANSYKLQPNAQADAKSIKDYINRQGPKRTHSDIVHPIGATDEEAKEIVEKAIDDVN